MISHHGPFRLSNLPPNLHTFIDICSRLVVPLAVEKVEDPSTYLTFLGITLDTSSMEICHQTRSFYEPTMKYWDGYQEGLPRRGKYSLWSDCCNMPPRRYVCCGWTFVGRMYQVAAKVKQMSFSTRFTKEFWSDIYWWHFFLSSWNGLGILCSSKPGPTDCCIQTDASGSWGCGALFGCHWFQWQWLADWSALGIMSKELVPIVMSRTVLGLHLRRQQVLIQCDNSNLVSAIAKGYSKEPSVMHLLRCLWFFIAYLNISIMAEHITGAINCAVDMLSRNNMTNFLLLHPRYITYLTHYQHLYWTLYHPTGQTGHRKPQHSVQQYYTNGAAQSTWNTYSTGHHLTFSTEG